MSENIPVLGIPALRTNPFQARPLERGQSKLLIGRKDVSARWARFLKAQNARMVLLVGETGSGRTSLMRCVSEETEKSVHLDMFPNSDHVSHILHEIYVSLVSFDVPSSTGELVSRLVSTTEQSNGPLPLISLDFSNADGKKLSDILSTLVNPLHRLNALVIVSLTTDQRALLPAALANRFDHSEVIMPMDSAQVKELCETRIASASKLNWNLPDDALNHIMEKTNGMPSKVMRLMRDMVDEERSNPREIKYDEPVQEFEPSNVTVSFEEDSGVEETIDPIFELNLDELESEPIIDQNPSPALPAMGAFGGLAARNRLNKIESPPFDKKNAPIIDQEPPGVDANSLWVSEEPEALLMEEETLLLEDEAEHFETNHENHYTEMPDSNKKDEIEGLFGQLLSALQAPPGVGVADFLAAIRRPVIGQKESNPLDMQTLRSLSRGEAVLVEVSSEREISPSDARLQDKLNVRRPRMSQMCNRLYRGGILSVQQKGRTRMFKLTNDARAQLVAWGMMEARV